MLLTQRSRVRCFHCLQGELRQHLAEAIETLPERERTVITLSYYEELTMKEIASVLGVGESRVSQMRGECCAQASCGVGELPLGRRS